MYRLPSIGKQFPLIVFIKLLGYNAVRDIL